MRRTALAIACATTGCNWLYGLDPTVAHDAMPDAKLVPSTLQWAIAAPTTTNKVVFAPIAELTTVQIGRLDEALVEVPYAAADGSFLVPDSLRGVPHRIAYTLPGESVPHEIQWSVVEAELVVPRTTRIDPAPVPAMSGYVITPNNFAGWNNADRSPRLATSGVFTYTFEPNDFEISNATVSFEFPANAQPVAGPLGAPIAAQDWVVLLEWGPPPSIPSSTAVLGWAKTSIDLMAGSLTVANPQPEWRSTPVRAISAICATQTLECVPMQDVPSGARMRTRLGEDPGAPGPNYRERTLFGVSPSLKLPAFLPAAAPQQLPRPLMLPLADTAVAARTFHLADPFDDLGLDRVLVREYATHRTDGAVALPKSLTVMSSQFAAPVTELVPSAPLSIAIRLGTTDLGTDNQSHPAASGVTTLTFQPETGSGVNAADDYLVTLYEVTATGLVPVRTYQVLDPSVSIYQSLLQAGKKYTFAISSRIGFPNADSGKYDIVAYPFAVSTTFSGTFTVQ